MEKANVKKSVLSYNVCLLVAVILLTACGNGNGAADESDSSMAVWQETDLNQEIGEQESTQ